MAVFPILLGCEGPDGSPTVAGSGEPTSPDRPGLTMGGASSQGCMPEGIVTRQGLTETILITFEGAPGCGSSHLIDGSPWGVNFGDLDPETPPGNKAWYWAADFQNLPSPVTAAMTVHSPFQSFLGFDPPVQSVEFHYATHNGLQFSCQPHGNCQPTFNIYAQSDFMGWTLASVTVAPNNSGEVTWDTWTPVQLSTFGDQIKWVYIEANLAIDDLKIVRAAQPSVECDTVARGSIGTCTITEAVEEVTEWRFEGLLSDGFISIPSNHPDTAWSGQVVAHGDVFAEVVIGGVPQTLWGELTVDARPWRWGPDEWEFIDGSALPPSDPGYAAWVAGCPFTEWVIPGLNPQEGTYLGVNGRQDGCAHGGFVDPRVATDTDPENPLGASYAQVNDGGPNDGVWYVIEPHHRMDRRSAINSSLTAEGPTRVLTFGQDISACAHLGLDPVEVGWYTYNVSCRGVPADSLVQAVWLHEGYGSMGVVSEGANGHQARLEWGASLMNGDPFFHSESQTAANRPSLHEQVGIAVGISDHQLLMASDTTHLYVRNNGWCDELWVYRTEQAQGPNNRYRSFQFGVCP